MKKSNPYYNCTECQKRHYGNDSLFDIHLVNQSKDGILSETQSGLLELEHGTNHMSKPVVRVYGYSNGNTPLLTITNEDKKHIQVGGLNPEKNADLFAYANHMLGGYFTWYQSRHRYREYTIEPESYGEGFFYYLTASGVDCHLDGENWISNTTSCGSLQEAKNEIESIYRSSIINIICDIAKRNGESFIGMVRQLREDGKYLTSGKWIHAWKDMVRSYCEIGIDRDDAEKVLHYFEDNAL